MSTTTASTRRASTRRTFRSDNNAGLIPEARDAWLEAADGHAPGYGDDEWTDAAVRAFRAIFGDDAAVYFVATGTAANVLSIASLTEPWQRIVCHRHAHLNDDESTAPERATGCRLTPVDVGTDKLLAEHLETAMGGQRGDVHQPQPGVVSVSNPTEFGEVYTPGEMRDLARVARAHGLRVHVDGARFANAVAALGCDPRAITADAGVDALSFGGTKNGLGFGEAVVFYPRRPIPGDGDGDGDGHGDVDRTILDRAAAAFPFHRKATGHLLSKHRFVAAPFVASLRDGAWLRHAAHANAMAARLAAGLSDLGVEIPVPTQANGVFARLSDEVDAALRAAGHGYYPFGDAEWGIRRFMCSFDTAPGDVEGLIADVATAHGGGDPRR